MSNRVKVLIAACVLMALILLAGCQQKIYQYPFDQAFSNVVKVEVFRYHYADYPADATLTLVAELDLEDAEELLQDISALPSHKHYGDFPMGSYGEIILYITYAGGEAEVVGMVNSASVRLDGVWWIKGYYFDSQQWCTVLTKYVDKELVPELEEYLK